MTIVLLLPFWWLDTKKAGAATGQINCFPGKAPAGNMAISGQPRFS
jgi:hypothetical protein